MLKKILHWFRKEEQNPELHLPTEESNKFVLKLKDLNIAYLECRNGLWSFYYADVFKKQEKYYPITGFPNLDKVYTSESLWPFFQIRIPGLGQPAVKEILIKENINKENELALLKRFGAKSISNPYTLVLV